MPLVSSIDYVARRIYLSAETVNADIDTLLVYKEVRERRRTVEADRRFRPMIVAGGNVPKIPGVSYTPIYVQLLYGCRLVPWNVSHTLRLVRDTFTDDGLAGRSVFDRSSLTAQVNIDVDFPAVEIREVSVGEGSGGTAPSVSQIWAASTSGVSPGTMGEALVLAKQQASIAAASSQQ